MVAPVLRAEFLVGSTVEFYNSGTYISIAVLVTAEALLCSPNQSVSKEDSGYMHTEKELTLNPQDLGGHIECNFLVPKDCITDYIMFLFKRQRIYKASYVHPRLMYFSQSN